MVQEAITAQEAVTRVGRGLPELDAAAKKIVISKEGLLKLVEIVDRYPSGLTQSEWATS